MCLYFGLYLFMDVTNTYPHARRIKHYFKISLFIKLFYERRKQVKTRKISTIIITRVLRRSFPIIAILVSCTDNCISYPRGRSFSRVKFHKFETENRHISARSEQERAAPRGPGRGCFAAWKRCHSIGRNRSSHGKRINSLAINESRPACDCFLVLAAARYRLTRRFTNTTFSVWT